MKKTASVLLASTILFSSVSAMPADADTLIRQEYFFVVVGRYGPGYTQLRYHGPDGADAEKVIWKDSEDTYEYGDVLATYDPPVMERVYDFPDSPNYAMSYYQELDGDTLMVPVGNCADYMWHETLTVTDKTYDGSGHWSIHLENADGDTYRYGLNTLGSELRVNPLTFEVGESHSFAMYENDVLIPLAEQAVLPIPPYKTPVLGDANKDYKVNAEDVALLQQWLLGQYVLIAADRCDLDDNGVIDARDLTILKRILDDEPPAKDSYTVSLTLKPDVETPVTRIVVTSGDWTMEYTAPEGGWTAETILDVDIPMDYRRAQDNLMMSSMIDPRYRLDVHVAVYQDYGKLGELLRTESTCTFYPAFFNDGRLYFSTGSSLVYDGSSGMLAITSGV